MAKQTEDLENLRVPDLREKAKAAGVHGTSHMRKDDLIEVLSEGQPDPNAEPRGNGQGKHNGGDVIDLLIADHEKVKALFKQVLHMDSDDARLKQLANQIAAELTLHTEAEETIFYPALKKKAVSAAENAAKDEVLEAYVEHGSVKELIAQLESLQPSDESYHAILQVMSEQVGHHVDEEESEMFKQARSLLSKQELIDIGQEVVAYKQSATASAP